MVTPAAAPLPTSLIVPASNSAGMAGKVGECDFDCDESMGSETAAAAVAAADECGNSVALIDRGLRVREEAAPLFVVVLRAPLDCAAPLLGLAAGSITLPVGDASAVDAADAGRRPPISPFRGLSM